ncbi:PREDICTED: PC-esterase domain-containing protein 1B-like [Elephantulus edwardii]|uniref:PC-esterase domain-containing protein 1B-like n=1 Tax=Elephantulus edwardii TaxID=28737 RepID=UPI0003F0B075|nr:PREDICTED: PC-esterase domain-containing protein 1B-like [Elephantulus edwardii]
MVHLFASEVRQLLHNKFVVVLGDSIQRTVYKDLVLLLQKDSLLTYHQLKEKYMEDILEELRTDSYTPDVLIMNSCLWDLSRYGKNPWKSYRQNLESLFQRLDETLPESCLRVWNTAMPLGQHITGSFLPRDQPLCTASLHKDVVEANFYSFTAAHRHRFDVLDLHFHFRHSQQFRQIDGVHWNEFAHRHLSQLLLAHVADAWEVELPNRRPGYQWNKRIRGRNGKAAERQPHASSCLECVRFLPPGSYISNTSILTFHVTS